jgi:hypothetical protein
MGRSRPRFPILPPFLFKGMARFEIVASRIVFLRCRSAGGADKKIAAGKVCP